MLEVAKPYERKSNTLPPYIGYRILISGLEN